MPLRQLAMPKSQEVHLWYLDLNLLGQSLQSAFESPEDAGHRKSLTLGQLRFARYFYLRLLLGAYLGLPGKSVHISRSERGKPVLDPKFHRQELHFSFAKSDDRVLVGFSSSGLVGVDLEPVDRRAHRPLAVAQRYFSAQEAAALAKMDAQELDHAFLRAWACKEAVVKASGEGIANQLCRFTVDMSPARPPVVLAIENGDAADWSLAVVQPESRYLGAVATHHGLMSFNAFRLLPAGS